MGGGSDQTNPALDQFQQYQQQQQQQQLYNNLGNTLSKSFQGVGQAVGQPMSMPQAFGQNPTGYGQLPQSGIGQTTGLGAAATGPLFGQPGMGTGGINQQQLAQILQALGYGG